jgi:hypothetical protein
MAGNIPTPPQEVRDCLAALQAVADLRPHRRDVGGLRTAFDVSSAEQGASVNVVAKATKNPQGSEPAVSLLVPQH